MTTHWTLSGDAADPQLVGAFWKRALGYIDEEGYDNADGAALVDPNSKLPAISFLKVPEGKTAKNRLHIDIRVAAGQQINESQRDELIRAESTDLLDAGATVVHEGSYDGHIAWIVMQDPEGNEFCVA